MYLLALLLSAMTVLPSAQTQRRPAAPAGPFKTTLTIAEMAGKQAVVETTAGSFVIDLRPDLAPNHVGYFLKLTREGAYVDTAFHRVVRHAITAIRIRDTPPPEPVPFANETPGQLAQHRAVLETTLGSLTIRFTPGVAPEHVRHFLQLAQAGVFDGTAFHRVVRGFVVQTGALDTRGPLTDKQQKLVHNLQPEFNGTNHVKGIVSMARGDDPASATTSFFIVTAAAPTLDGKYTVFGRVIDGLDVLDRIESTPVSGESPTTRIDLIKVRIAG
jgi:peptidyl-prolyl cis-trans isomerase B (cyclophilin B)